MDKPKRGPKWYSEPGMKLAFRVRGGKSVNNIFFKTPKKHLFRREMLYSQYFTTFSQQVISGRL